MNTARPIRVLVAEDEEHLGTILEHFLRGRGYAVTMCRDGKTALATLRRESYDVALVDIVMPEMDGLEVLRHLQSEPDRPQVIIITGNGTIDTAITAIRLGAYDYISKPYRMAEIDVMVRRAWEKRELLRANHLLRERAGVLAPVSIPASSARMREVLDELAALAPTDAPVILHGESGVGKRYLARYVHRLSGRQTDAYIELSRAERGGATPESGAVAPSITAPQGAEGSAVGERSGTAFPLPDADPATIRLFGEERSGNAGAVSGVDAGSSSRRLGMLQLAAAGTVAIDAALLSPRDRAALADALTHGRFTRVGGTQPIPLHARVILCERAGSASASPFPGARVTIPPLRERVEDIAALAAELLHELGDGPPRTLAPAASPALQEYSWPGNIRELRAVLTRAALLAPGPEITDADLRMVLLGGAGPSGAGAPLADLERLHIEAILIRNGWHQGRAADALGISTKTLYRKMREYGFVRPRNRKLARGRGRRTGSS